MNSKFHINNRKKLMDELDKNSILYLESKDEIIKGDSEHFDFPDYNIFHLTGIEQAKTKLIITKNSNGIIEEYLFILDRDQKMEMWVGKRLSLNDARKISGIKNVYYEKDYNEISEKLFPKYELLYYYKYDRLREINKSSYQINYEKIKRKYKLSSKNFFKEISKLRQTKTDEEIALIKKAMKITNLSFRNIIKNIKSYKSENEIEAQMTYDYIKNNCKHSYHPIIASGNNANTLHYIKNNDKLKKGDLILIDCGAEYNNYKTDITRTFPISGKFSKRQKEVYTAVLDVQKYAIKLLKSNLDRIEWEKSVNKFMAQKLIELKLITKDQFEKDKQILRKFYPHATGHFLGLDTHDLGDFYTKFQIGEVYTVEPGIYIEKEKIGIRIEDNVLITKSGCEVLSKSIPKEIKILEKLSNYK